MGAKKKTTLAAVPESKQRQNLGARARGEAMKQLIESYPERWEELLRQEREKVGLPAEGGRQTRLQKLAERMLMEGVERDVLNQALAEAGFKARA